MTPAKDAKDLILVHCQEVPETVCVETRFITQSGKPNNVEPIFSSNNGSIVTDKDDQITSTKNVLAIAKTPTFAVNIQPKLVNIRPNITNTTVQQCQIPQQAESVNSFVPLNAPLANFNNTNTFNNFSHLNNVLRPLAATQLNNTPQLSPFILNNAVLAAPHLGSSNTQNIPNIAHCFNEQTQQTEISSFNRKSIAIQCTLDEELEDLHFEFPDISKEFCENNSENEMESFLKFIENNSTQHQNYKECLICGELCKSNKYFYGHMAVHRGPKALCFKCGQYLEHENLLPEHNCQKAEQLAKVFLRCPHFACDVNAMSLLELYDHINEHTNNRLYKCSACRKGFCTGQEFLRHILIRAKCYTSAKRKRFRLYGLESRDRHCRVRVFTLHTYKKCTTLVKSFLTRRAQKKGVCKICLKSFNKKNVYKSHRLTCIARFKKRLMDKKKYKKT